MSGVLNAEGMLENPPKKYLCQTCGWYSDKPICEEDGTVLVSDPAPIVVSGYISTITGDLDVFPIDSIDDTPHN